MIRIALIGLGRWGNNVARTIQSMKECELSYVNDNAQKTLQLNTNSKTVLSYRELLSKDIDGVIIATPGSTHAKIALPFIEKGIPTFIEKPMATSLRDAHKILRAQKKSKTTVFVGHIHLYNPAFRKALRLQKQLGTIKMLYFEGTNYGPRRTDMSALWDWAPHDISMAIAFLKSSPSCVQAWGEKLLHPNSKFYDSTEVRLLFPHSKRNGSSSIPVIIINSWLFPEKRRRMTILGSMGSLVFDDTSYRKLTMYIYDKPSKKNVPENKSNTRISHPSYSQHSPLQEELKAFVHCIISHKKPMTDAQNGLDVVRIIDAAQRSIHIDGRKIKIYK